MTAALTASFADAPIDVLVLEVGLGGRLDAVNIIDTDCAIITSIDLDHTELLGDTREAIAKFLKDFDGRGRLEVREHRREKFLAIGSALS